MTYNPDDPRLTMYALGEMPEDEQAEFEAGLDDEARAEIEDIRQTAALLQGELAAEATPSLSDSQRVRIMQTPTRPIRRKRRFHWVVWLAAAACFAVLVGVMTWPEPLDRVYKASGESIVAQKALPEEESLMADGDDVKSTLIEEGRLRLDQPHSLPAPSMAYEETLRADTRQATEARVPHEQTKTESAPKMGFFERADVLTMSPRVEGAYADTGVRPEPARPQASPAPPPSPEPPVLHSVEVNTDGMDGQTIAHDAAPATKVTAIPGEMAVPTGQDGGTVGSGGMSGGAMGGVTGGAMGGGNGPVLGGAPLGGLRFTNQVDEPEAPGSAPKRDSYRRSTSLSLDYRPVAGSISFDMADASGTVDPSTIGTMRPEQPESHIGMDFSREAYDRVTDNPFKLVRQDPLSTFSIDVDTASYANVRRFLTRNQLPPPDAVRIEELVNYFRYDYEQPKGERPFSVGIDLAQCPWAPKHRLARVALKGREPDLANRPASNLVFLLDVSGSMREPNKLPLVKQSMKLLVDQLNENDRVGIVVYAGASGMVLPSTSCDRKEEVLGALDRLQAGGSTNGGAGIQLAYQTAVDNFIKGGTNRVILATDGDFNVGISDRGQLTRLIEDKAKSGVFLTVLGYGNGNLQDAMLEEISGKGNGTYAYIDSLREAKKVMVEQIGGTLLTIAKDVKIQVEFNPARIGAYRLIGYENRMLQHQDFNDDTKDAGEIGAGLTVTAFYELVPRGLEAGVPGVDALKYQTTALADEAVGDEAMTVKLRYKLPDGDTSTLIEEAVKDQPRSMKDMSDDYVFATSVAAFGMVLRDSPYKGSASLGLAQELAQTGARRDPNGYRKEFLELVAKAQQLKKAQTGQ